MSNQEIWSKITKSISTTETFRPARITIPPENIKSSMLVTEKFEKHKHYFEVVVNEMYLSYKRKWFTTYQPIVFVTTQFLYQGETVAAPFIVGPQMLKDKQKNIPEGMIYENTQVAGLHPYRGGSFTLQIVLGRMQINNYLKKIIGILENTTGTYLGAFATAVLAYTKVAGVIMKSMEELFDSQDIEPLIGQTTTFNPNTNDNFRPGFFALINQSEDEVDKNKFFVINQKLHFGDTIETAKPFREDDYVLYSILAATSRNDSEALPFHSQFVQLQQIIASMGVTIGPDEKKILEAKLFALNDAVRMSPDLVRDQVSHLIKEFREEIVSMIDDRRPLSHAVRQLDDRDEWEKKMDKELTEMLFQN